MATSNPPIPPLAAGRTAQADTAAALSSAISIERALSRFGWLGDPDDLLAKLGIDRTKLRALEHDDEITAAIETRRDASLVTPWRFEHPQARARKFFTDAFAHVMPQLLAASWQAVPYGYSVAEIVYTEPADPANTTPGKIGIGSVLECPMEWFRIVPGGDLLWRDQNQPADPRKFFASVRQPTLRKPMGDAILAKAYWPWYFRTHGWKYWAKFLEQAAVPLLVGKTIGDKEGLLGVLRSVTQGPAIAINDTDTLDALDLPGNSANKFTEFEIACVRRIQRLILGQTLTSGTDGGSGNRALGQVHNEVRMDKKRADVAMLSAHIQRMANMLAALNGMEPAKFIMEDGSGLERERADRDKVLTDAGMLRFTPEYLREKYGLEESDFTVPEPAGATPAQNGAPSPPTALSAKQLTAVNTYLSASSNLVNLVDGHNENRHRFTAGQQAIEDEVDRTLASFTTPIQAKAIASAIRAATGPDDLIERLGVAMADADDRQFRTTLERALFAADLMGYGQTQQRNGLPVQDASFAAAPAQPTGQIVFSPEINVNLRTDDIQASLDTAVQTMAQAHADKIKLIGDSMPINITLPDQPAPVVNVTVDAPTVNVTNDVQPAPVTVNNAFAKQATQTVQRDANDEIISTTTVYK